MIRTIFILSFFTLIPFFSLADCAGGGMYFWPKTEVISQNPIIMIQGYARDQDIIAALNTDYPVYLQSGDEKIKLTVKETCIGQMYLTQVVLIPESKLTAGKVYDLNIDNLPGREQLTVWNYEKSKHEKVSWKVIEGEDHLVPSWTKRPSEIKKTLMEYGCGPAMNVHFNFTVSDDSPVLLRTTVNDLKTGTSTIYYLEVLDGNTVQIGHGMCMGAFTFDEKSTDYTVTFDLVDASGNFTLWGFDAIPFTKPTHQNSKYED